MPTWAVAISVLATALSAATFVGGPQLGYLGRTSYLLTNIGGLLAVCIVGFWFIPAFYRTGVTSVYELVGHRFGGQAQRAASGMFMLGRLLASGARLFIVAIPFSLVAFNDVSVPSLSISIMLITVVACCVHHGWRHPCCHLDGCPAGCCRRRNGRNGSGGSA